MIPTNTSVPERGYRCRRRRRGALSARVARTASGWACSHACFLPLSRLLCALVSCDHVRMMSTPERAEGAELGRVTEASRSTGQWGRAACAKDAHAVHPRHVPSRGHHRAPVSPWLSGLSLGPVETAGDRRNRAEHAAQPTPRRDGQLPARGHSEGREGFRVTEGVPPQTEAETPASVGAWAGLGEQRTGDTSPGGPGAGSSRRLGACSGPAESTSVLWEDGSLGGRRDPW